MSIERFFTTAVTILTPGATETRRHDFVPDWTNATAISTFGWLTQVSTLEEIGARDVVVTGWKLYLPASTSISAGCRVTAGSSVYAVDGDPHHAQTPGGTHHIEVALRYVAEVEVD